MKRYELLVLPVALLASVVLDVINTLLVGVMTLVGWALMPDEPALEFAR